LKLLHRVSEKSDHNYTTTLLPSQYSPVVVFRHSGPLQVSCPSSQDSHLFPSYQHLSRESVHGAANGSGSSNLAQGAFFSLAPTSLRASWENVGGGMKAPVEMGFVVLQQHDDC
jgi:hypothetical protein